MSGVAVALNEDGISEQGSDCGHCSEDPFAILDEILEENFQGSQSEPIPIRAESTEERCSHSITVQQNDIVVCEECGKELQLEILLEKDWRGPAQNGGAERCHLRRTTTPSIAKEVEAMEIPAPIILVADQIYEVVSSENQQKKRIYRGENRKAIILACIYEAYKRCNQPVLLETIFRKNQIKRTAVTKGVRLVQMSLLRNRQRMNKISPSTTTVSSSEPTPLHQIKDILRRFEIDQQNQREISDLYQKIENRSSQLNRSRPRSVAAGLVYYYICLHKRKVTLEEYSVKIGLSTTTILKNAKEISRLFVTPQVLRY